MTILGQIIDQFSYFYPETGLIELNQIFLVYVVLLVVFCTNAINILAGINGIETGQSFVIACALLMYVVLRLSPGISFVSF